MSARRQARAAGGAPTPVASTDSLEALLSNADASVWQHFDEWGALLVDHDWEVPLSWLWRDLHPANRRHYVAELWSVENGHGRDWHYLRRIGFIG